MNLQVLKARLRSKLREKRLTQAELGAKLRQPAPRWKVARWLGSGKATPSLGQLIDISVVLETSGAWLVGRTDDDRPPEYPTTEERALLALYRQLDADGKVLALEGLGELRAALGKAKRR